MLKDNNNINLICVRKNVAIITEILFNLLENNNFLSDNELVYDHKKRKDYKIYKLNSNLDPIFSLSIQLPNLVKPRKLKKKDVDMKRFVNNLTVDLRPVKNKFGDPVKSAR